MLFNDLSHDSTRRLLVHVGYIVSEILVKKRKLFTLIIHCTEVPLYKNIYILFHISPYTGQIWLAMDNKYIKNGGIGRGFFTSDFHILWRISDILFLLFSGVSSLIMYV